jgi:hypothetical protein
MGIMKWLFGADAVASSDAMKLDGTNEATLARSLSALPAEERGWITFAEARTLFSSERAEYGDNDGLTQQSDILDRLACNDAITAGICDRRNGLQYKFALQKS